MLQEAVNTSVENLLNMVSKIRESTGNVSAAETEISQGNADLSQRTEEQASSLEETASSMEEMTSTVKQNADNAAKPINWPPVPANRRNEVGRKSVTLNLRPWIRSREQAICSMQCPRAHLQSLGLECLGTRPDDYPFHQIVFTCAYLRMRSSAVTKGDESSREVATMILSAGSL